MRSRHGQRCCLGALCLASPAITTHTHVHPPAARDLAPRHPSILDPTPQKSLTQSNPRSWNLRRRAGRWDRSVRALIRRAPRACSEAFWKRRWQTLAVAGVRCTIAQSSQPPGPTARISCCDILPPRRRWSPWRGKAEEALRAVTPTSFLLLLFRACNGPGLATARKMWAACCIFCSPPLYH